MGRHFGFQGGFSAVVAKDNLTLRDSKVKSATHSQNYFLDISDTKTFSHLTSLYFLFLFPTKKQVRKYHQRFQSSTNPSESV